jgi:8-hydroxy-5-deazaflavin:NADPH oxidoreductase
MKVGVLGTGAVGRTIATKLIDLGHEVTMGSRSDGNEQGAEWAAGAGAGASAGTFADATSAGELIVNCTKGSAALDALRAAGAANLEGKVLVDVSNPLDFSGGMPPTLAVCNTDSLGEQIQREFPATRVVKALNTMNHELMVDPGQVGGSHVVFVCGDDASAKAEVGALLETFGWPGDRIVDLGDISAARGTEGYLPLWLRLYGALGSASFNIAIER